jgi:hypothetical protein
MGMSRVAFMEMVRECRVADKRMAWKEAPAPPVRSDRDSKDRQEEKRHEWLIALAADLADTTPGLVTNGCRERAPVCARQIICLCLSRQGYSSVQIGNVLRYHHSSVLHLLKLGQIRYERDADFRAKVDAVGDGVFTTYWGT